MKTLRITALVALVLMGLAGVSGAQTTRLTLTDGHEAADLAAQGWTEVAEGLWQRGSMDGRKETFVTSAAGLEKVLPVLREQEARLMETFLAKPTRANRKALDAQTQLVAAVEANLIAARAKKPAAKADEEAAAACTRNFSYGADVRSFHCYDVADASASYSTSNPTACPEQCTVHAYSYISTTCGGTLMENTDSCTQTGTNVSCSTWADGYFSAPCYDYAFASIHCPQLNNLYLSQSDYTTGCFCGC